MSLTPDEGSLAETVAFKINFLAIFHQLSSMKYAVRSLLSLSFRMSVCHVLFLLGGMLPLWQDYIVAQIV